MAERRRKFTNAEILGKLQDYGNDFERIAEDVCQSLLPNLDGELESSQAMEKFERIVDNVRKKLAYFYSSYRKKARFKSNDDYLSSVFISSSQHSIFASQQTDSQQSQGSLKLDAIDPSPSVEEFKKIPLHAFHKAFQRRLAVQEERALFQKWAEKFNCSIPQLAGYFIYLDSFMRDKKLAAVGWSLFQGNSVQEKHAASVEEAIWIMERCSLSESSYQELRLCFLERFTFPPLYIIAEESKRARPSLEHFRHGVKASLHECMALTLQEILPAIKDSIGLDDEISFSFHYGMDGSGLHKDYNPKKGFSTKNVFLAAFSISEIRDSQGKPIWSGSSKGANRPQNVRPWAIYPEKESYEIVKEFSEVMDDDIIEIRSKGIELKRSPGRVVTATLRDSPKMSMIDGKMISQLLQLGGAYCTMCPLSCDDCHDEATVQEGFQISRTVSQLCDLAISLENPDTGEIIKAPRDYAVRQGLTGFPLTTAAVTENIPVLHAKIRVFEWTMDLLTRQNSHHKWKRHFQRQEKYSAGETSSFKRERSKLKARMQERFGINIDDPQSMVTRECFKRMSSDTARNLLGSFIKESAKQEDFKTIHLQLCAIVRVLNSQRGEVNLEKFRALCTETYLLILKSFPWAYITQSLHRILGHSWERIQMNENHGLGTQSEEGLESLNKLIRYNRAHGARKTSSEDNFMDTFNHLWRRSRPAIVNMEREVKKRKSKVVVLNEIDMLVQSLFVEDTDLDE